MKKLSEKSVGMSGLLLTNVFALSGGPRHHKNPFARGIPPRPLLASRPARRPIDSLRPAACWTLHTLSLICFSCSFSAGPVGLLLAATRVCRSPGSTAARRSDDAGAEDGRPGHPPPPPIASPSSRSHPPPPFPMTAPCHSDRLSPSSLTRTSSSSCRSGLPRSRQHLVWADVPPRPDQGRLAGREPSMITRATLTCSRKASAWRDYPGGPRSEPHSGCSICREPSPPAALRVAWRSNVVFVQSDFIGWQQDAAYNP